MCCTDDPDVAAYCCCLAADSCQGTLGKDFVNGEVINDGKREITNSNQECCQKCNARSGECALGNRTQMLS